MIRPFRPEDRAAVRTICCDTADKGKPVEGFFRDRELFSDLMTRYYTDWEPRSSWVAEQDGKVIGYLTGCLETHRYRKLMLVRVIPAAVAKAVLRGTLFSLRTWRFLLKEMLTWLRGGYPGDVPRDLYPAHLHLNVIQGHRGQHVGHRLLERFVEQAREAGLRGIHLATRRDNLPARQFFEQMGFRELPSRSTRTTTVVYGKRF